MIGEIIPSFYDTKGKPIGPPTTKRRKRLFHSTFPIGRYVSRPLSVKCSSVHDIRRFLSSCKYVSDEELFGREDYWMPPEKFEEMKKGDCDDFALWTWRQFMNLGYKARFVIGRAGKYGEGHAWVTIERDGKHYLVEPLAWPIGIQLPRLNVARYEPRGSVEWDGKRLRYFVHEKPNESLPISEYASLTAEWLAFWADLWLHTLKRLGKVIVAGVLRNLIIETDSETPKGNSV